MTKNNVNCTHDDDYLSVLIYLKSSRTGNYVIKNVIESTTDLKQTDVVYNFKSPLEDCSFVNNVNCIVFIITTLTRRLTMHLTTGAIKTHFSEHHHKQLVRTDLTDNVSIIRKQHAKTDLTDKLSISRQNHSPEQT